jgi:hypothetical protein
MLVVGLAGETLLEGRGYDPVKRRETRSMSPFL